ncbi:hypothetical protein [Rubellimicrobium sp. CFH 75288]|uniref:hypothetical protein n=1 Tax=Rubellimicrobium sp. CFH 75288 TaxID=2697034 RepID=UPI00141240BB|nr:hypothetical protein [Rubellimicrobium sp. CFH 75288]
MANTSDSFIDEVTEAVRRERLHRWFRRWGWLVGLGLLAIVGGAAFLEWRNSRALAEAQARGDALLAALEAPDGAERLAALAALPEHPVARLLLAAEQAEAGDVAAAAASYDRVAQDATLRPLWRDLAALKAQMVRGAEADPAALEMLAAPGAPFRLLALEQRALWDLRQGDESGAVARLRDLLGEDGIGSAQADRVSALLTALGEPPAAAEPDPPLITPQP